MLCKMPPSIDAIIRIFDAFPHAPLDLMDVRAKLAAERQALREAGATPQADAEAWHEMVVFTLSPAFDDGENPWQSFFRPISSMSNDQGEVRYFPDITEADSAAIAHWADRARNLTHPALKARYADVVWEFERLITKAKRRTPEMAQIAIDGYIDAVNKGLYKDSHSAFTYAQRAVDLAANFNDSVRLERARSALIALHTLVMAEDTSYLRMRAFDHLIDHKRAGATSAEIESLVRDLETVLAHAADAANPKRFDPHTTRDAAQRLVRYYTAKGLPDETKRLGAVVGKAFEFVAGQGDAMLAATFLQDSMEAYKKAGLPEDAERIRVALEGAVRASAEEMGQVSVPFAITKDEMDQFVAAVVVDDLGQTLFNIASYFLPNAVEQEEQMKRMAKEAPLHAMLSQQVFADDHVAAKVGSVEDDPSGRLLRHVMQALQLHVPFLHACLSAAREKHALTPDHLIPWVNRQGLFGAGKLPLLASGLQAWLDGDSIKALHVLIPQIENGLRRMVEMTGRPVTKPAGTVPSVSVSINMGDILFNVATVAALGPKGEDFALYMKALYADPRGLNLRNQFAHGLLDADEIHDGHVLWLIHTLILIGAWDPADRT